MAAEHWKMSIGASVKNQDLCKYQLGEVGGTAAWPLTNVNLAYISTQIIAT